MSRQGKTREQLVSEIFYSDKYEDDVYEYRHVILPKALLKYHVPPNMFMPGDVGVLRILSENEWRGIGIMQSLGWEHYEVHVPEPNILLFRRELNYQQKYGQAGRPPQ